MKKKDEMIMKNNDNNNNRVIFFEDVSKTLDIESAKKFGNILILFDNKSKEIRRPSIFNTKEFSKAVYQRLYDIEFDPKKDSIAISGSIIPICVIVAIAFEIQSPLRLLFYNANTSQYEQHLLESYLEDDLDTKER